LCDRLIEFTKAAAVRVTLREMKAFTETDAVLYSLLAGLLVAHTNLLTLQRTAKVNVAGCLPSLAREVYTCRLLLVVIFFVQPHIQALRFLARRS
jgi:hypothetical protein